MEGNWCIFKRFTFKRKNMCLPKYYTLPSAAVNSLKHSRLCPRLTPRIALKTRNEVVKSLRSVLHSLATLYSVGFRKEFWWKNYSFGHVSVKHITVIRRDSCALQLIKIEHLLIIFNRYYPDKMLREVLSLNAPVKTLVVEYASWHSSRFLSCICGNMPVSLMCV